MKTITENQYYKQKSKNKILTRNGDVIIWIEGICTRSRYFSYDRGRTQCGGQIMVQIGENFQSEGCVTCGWGHCSGGGEKPSTLWKYFIRRFKKQTSLLRNMKKKTYTKTQVLNILDKLRDKLWKISNHYHKPHNELKTPCSEGTEALNELEVYLIDEIVKVKE